MAILDDLGFAVTIRVGGEDCEELVDPYAVSGKENDHPNICERYIESTAGLEFEICIDFLKGGPACEWASRNERNAYAVAYTVDGVEEVWVYGAGGRLSADINSGFTRMVDTEAWTVRNFRFGELSSHRNTISEEQLDVDRQLAKIIGQIRVTIRRVLETDSYPMGVQRPVDEFGDSPLSLHWKALKGSSLHHAATLSPEVRHSGKLTCQTSRFIDPEHLPSAVFIFNYRSKKGLQEELIIPRPQSSSTTADVPVDVASLSLDKLKSLARQRIAAVQAADGSSKMGVEEEPVDVDKLPVKGLIRLTREALGDVNMVRNAMAEVGAQNQGTPMDSEEFAKLYNVAIVDGFELIDLTGDDEEKERDISVSSQTWSSGDSFRSE